MGLRPWWQRTGKSPLCSVTFSASHLYCWDLPSAAPGFWDPWEGLEQAPPLVGEGQVREHWNKEGVHKARDRTGSAHQGWGSTGVTAGTACQPGNTGGQERLPATGTFLPSRRRIQRIRGKWGSLHSMERYCSESSQEPLPRLALSRQKLSSVASASLPTSILFLSACFPGLQLKVTLYHRPHWSLCLPPYSSKLPFSFPVMSPKSVSFPRVPTFPHPHWHFLCLSPTFLLS